MSDVEQLDSELRTAWVTRYQGEREDLLALYEKAKREQWDGRTALPWQEDVDPERENFPDAMVPIYGSEIWAKLGRREIEELRRHSTAWMLSQFLHGEQGALLATSQLVDVVPTIDAKLYGATQVMDEARHVEVYERYLREKVELTYPVSPELKALLDRILTDPRWDMKFLGMQILVEGLALAAFRFVHDFSGEPLIKSLTRHVMLDEARHVAFGVLSLRRHYQQGLSERDLAERVEFTYEACRLMRDRFLQKEVWERLGYPVERCLELTLESPAMKAFRQMLFSRIVPNVKRLGLLTPWLRERFGELGILAFEELPADA